MKRTISCVLASFVTLQSTYVFAQNNGTPVPVVVAGGGAGTTKVTAYNDHGNYDLNNLNLDLTASASQVFSAIKDAQQIDRDYLKGLVDNLTDKLNELSNLKRDFQDLANESATGRLTIKGANGTQRETLGNEKRVKLVEYLKMVQEIKNKDQIIQNELSTMSNMTRESLPSYDTASVGGKDIKGVSAGNVDTSALVAKVEAKRAQIIADINNVKFYNLLAARNQVRSIEQNALNPNLSGLSVLEEADRAALQSKLEDLRTLTPKTQNLLQQLTDKTVNLVNFYVSSYGSEQQFRWRDENDMKAAQEAFQNIVNAFKKRSYIRKMYGPIGALQSGIDYEKQMLNWDSYGLQFQPLKVAVSSLKRQAAIDEADVVKAFENARLFLQLYDEKTTEVFNKRSTTMAKDVKTEDYSSQSTGFLVRANSAVTFITGQRPTAETLLAIMRLALEDAREEKTLLQGNRDQMVALSDKKFRSTPDMKAQYAREMCQADWTMTDEAFKAICPEVGVRVKAKQMVTPARGASIANVISDLLGQYKNSENARWKEAEAIQSQLNADLSAGLSTDERKQEDDAKTQEYLENLK